MTKHSTGLKASTLAIGAAALLLWAPIASADDPPSCDQNDQQCQDQQNPGAGIAKQAIDDAKKGMDPAKQGMDQGQKPVDLADKNCWVVDGVPTMRTPGLTTSPGQRAMPCYYVYGLQPH